MAKVQHMLFKKSRLGWRLMRQSLTVLQAQKKLLIFPLIGRGFFFLIILAMTIMVWTIRSGKIDYHQLSSQQIYWGYAILLLALWFGNWVSSYFNAALTACLLQEENAQPIRLSLGLRMATRRLPTLLAWVGAHFTLGFIITLFRNKFRESGRVNQVLSGLSWQLAAFLIPPLIINEPAGFISTLQRSSQLMRGFAGKTPQINYSYTALSFFVRLMSLIPLFVGYQMNRLPWIIAGNTITCILLLGIVVMFNAILVVLHQGLYQYITHGRTVSDFNTPDLAAAITPSKSKSRIASN